MAIVELDYSYESLLELFLQAQNFLTCCGQGRIKRSRGPGQIRVRGP